jgi:hypothetical protein
MQYCTVDCTDERTLPCRLSVHFGRVFLLLSHGASSAIKCTQAYDKDITQASKIKLDKV